MLISGVFLFAAKYAGSWEMLIVGRLIIGINSGLNAGLAPMYLNEISPTALRGAVGTVYQLIITISILLSQILGLTNVLGNDMGWPFLLGLTIIPGILQVIILAVNSKFDTKLPVGKLISNFEFQGQVFNLHNPFEISSKLQ